MTCKRVLASAVAGLCVVLNATDPISAQFYPTKPIRILVPAGPGGPNDVLARIVAQGLQLKLGQGVIVEHRPGAGGGIAAKAAASADPDGYTLLLGNTATLAVRPAVARNPGYDPIKSFAAVAKITEAYQVLVVHPTFPARSIQEFISYAKANPGKVNFASSGVGNPTHLAGELFKSKAGIDIVHVAYKSDGESVTAILGDQVQMTFGSVAVLLPLIQEGKLKALAVTSTTRSPELADVPTMIESGLPGYVVTTFFGLVAPAGTPSTIIDKLNVTLNQVLESPETKVVLAKLGVEPKTGTPQEFAAFIAGELQKWTMIANSADVKID